MCYSDARASVNLDVDTSPNTASCSYRTCPSPPRVLYPRATDQGRGQHSAARPGPNRRANIWAQSVDDGDEDDDDDDTDTEHAIFGHLSATSGFGGDGDRRSCLTLCGTGGNLEDSQDQCAQQSSAESIALSEKG